MTTFAQWQEQECAMLGITIEQHGAMQEVANKIDAAVATRDAYDALRSMILDSQWRELGEKLRKAGLA